MFYLLFYIASSYYINRDFKVTKSKTGDYIANAQFNNTANSTGWIFLKITTNPEYSDEQQFYAAGFLEGYLTANSIWDAWRNYINSILGGKTELPTDVQSFVTQQYEWMKEFSKIDNVYWRQIRNILLQLEGMYDGYNQLTHGTEKKLTFWQFYFLSNMGDLGDILPSIGEKMRGNIGNCNSFHLKDIVAHNTFNIYSLMLRVFKTYEFRTHDSINSLSFSSRPGDLESKDDFVMVGDFMMVTETSLSNWNKNNYKYLHTDSVPCWIRVNVASRLAKTPEDWAKYFEIFRSGTHNNQWIVTNFTNTLVVEEAFYLYHVIPSDDFYVAGYNLPISQDIYEQQGFQSAYPYNYDTDPRAVQFAKYAKENLTLLEVGKIIRYNRPDYDNCNEALSPRCDLNGGFTFGGIDAKVTSKDLLKQGKVLIISSPSYQEHPPFNWKDFESTSHYGMVDEWKFPWYEYSIKDFKLNFVQFLQSFKSHDYEKASQLATQILKVNPQNRQMLKFQQMMIVHKEQIKQQNQQESSSSDEQEQEDKLDSDIDPNDVPEAEELIEPMYDEQEYQEQKIRFTANLAKYQNPTLQEVRQCMEDAKKKQ